MLKRILILATFVLSAEAALAKGVMAVPPMRGVPPGSILVKESEKALYFVFNDKQAIRYPVATGKEGMKWGGEARIVSKHWRPAWAPPAIVKRDNPHLLPYYPSGHPDNPMGSAALLLDLDEIAIHGTTRKTRESIGTSASYGCIRMYNEDIEDLYQRVRRGALVIMMK